MIELKRGFDLPDRERRPGRVPLVSSSGVTASHSEARVKGPGVVTGRYGTLGKVFYVEDDFWPLNTTLYVRDFKGNDPRFISYFLQTIDFSAFSDKAAVPGLNRNHLHEAEVQVPSGIGEQRAIAHILGTLDDKVELNRRMSETMEAIARALFKSWFVDFEPVRAKAEGRGLSLPQTLADLFPDALQKSELGEVPRGWNVGRIGEEFRLTMGQSPPGESYNEVGQGLPFYQGRTDFGLRFPARRVFCSAPTRLAAKGDTLVSVRAPVGDVNTAVEDCAIGRGVAAARHKTGCSAYSYYFMRAQKQSLSRFDAEGTVFGSIGKLGFHALPCIVPPREVVMEFDSRVGAIDSRIEAAEMEATTLLAIRDRLLPRLVSGQVRTGKMNDLRICEGDDVAG